MNQPMNHPDPVAVGATIPIIQLWNVLLVPLQGEILDHQVEQLRADVLARVQRSRARHLVIDVSGVWLMDSHMCMVVSQLSKAARFMGTSTILTGLSPDVAQTLQAMGLKLGAGRTMRSLEDALELLGVRPPQTDRRAAASDDDVRRRIGARASSPAAAPMTLADLAHAPGSQRP